MKKKITPLLIMILIITSLTGCNQAASAQTGETASGQTVETSKTQESSDESKAQDSADDGDDEITKEFQEGKYLKLGSGISSLSGKESDYIFEQIDKYYGQGVLTDVDMTSKTAQFYTGQTDDNNEYTHRDCTLYFIDEEQSVPYMTLDDLVKISNETIEADNEFGEDARFTITGVSDGDEYCMSRENGSSVHIDFENNLICLIDYGKFTTADTCVSPVDAVTVGSGKDGDILKHYSTTYIKGDDLVIDLNAYGIHLIKKDGVFYFPVSTFSDLFMIRLGEGVMLGYNTQDLFGITSSISNEPNEDNTKSYGQVYYDVKAPEKRSEFLIDYTYSELCLVCDFHYGLKEEHGITSFNEYFASTGLHKLLLSDDYEQYYIGLLKLTMVNFADSHSGVPGTPVFAPELNYMSEVNAISTGEKRTAEGIEIAHFVNDKVIKNSRGLTYRKEIYGADVPMGYYEIGDTAFVTFDAFLVHNGTDYTTCEIENTTADTIVLAMYAHSQITREGSPIKNVVLNLAQNGGGEASAAATIIAWFAGTSANFSIINTTTGETGVTRYMFDANRDGKYDADDVLSSQGYNLYCVTSEKSFSCGNLVPAALKSSGNVLILGRTSGGGTCVVQQFITPDGLPMQISGQLRINAMKNGIYYDVDNGVEPDVIISDRKNIFDNEYIVELIHNLK